MIKVEVVFVGRVDRVLTLLVEPHFIDELGRSGWVKLGDGLVINTANVAFVRETGAHA